MLESLTEIGVGGGATIVGSAWGLKELFSFLLKWQKVQKDSTRSYQPNEEWRAYCMDKFESILEEIADTKQVFLERLSAVKTDVAVLESKLDHHECGGMNPRRR